MKIKITWDFAGFAFEVGGKTFETDYCGFPRPEEIGVIQELLEYLGHDVEVECLDNDDEDEDDGDHRQGFRI